MQCDVQGYRGIAVSVVDGKDQTHRRSRRQIDEQEVILLGRIGPVTLGNNAVQQKGAGARPRKFYRVQRSKRSGDYATIGAVTVGLQ